GRRRGGLGRAAGGAGVPTLHRNRRLGYGGGPPRRRALAGYARMKSSFARVVVAVLVVALLAACGHSRVVKREGGRGAARPASVEVPRDGSYTVRRGDTLYGIAFRHGLDYREVAGWNGIRAP